MLGISRTPGYLGFDATSMLANLNTEFEKNELAMCLVNVQKIYFEFRAVGIAFSSRLSAPIKCSKPDRRFNMSLTCKG